MKKKQTIKDIGIGILLSCSISFLLCIYAPMELFLTNTSEFWFSFSSFVPPVIILFLAVFALCALGFIIARLINKKFYEICLIGIFSYLISAYIQGNFFLKNLPPLNGTRIDWNAYPAERLKSILAFVIPFLILLFVLIKFRSDAVKKIISVGSVCFFLLFAVTLTTLALTTNLEKKTSYALSEKNEFQMSDDQNLIVLILDSVDNNTLKQAIKNDSEFEELLDGFTYYDNALAGYPFTSRSLPLIFSGDWYENSGDFGQYRSNAISTSPFITKLEKENYKIGIYESYDIDLYKDIFENRIENSCMPKMVSYKSPNHYLLIAKMAAVKFAPWDLKKVSENLSDYLFMVRTADTEYSPVNESDAAFYRTLCDSNPIDITDDRCARIIHLEGAHEPNVYDIDFNYKENGTYAESVSACEVLVKKYISRLKESGVYDNSAIVILADHGSTGNGIEVENEEIIKQRMNPFLMVKGIGEKHAFSYSSAPVSYEDLAEGIAKLIDKNPGNAIFDYSDGDVRTRRFWLYSLYNSKHMKEFSTDGLADEFDKFTETGRCF